MKWENILPHLKLCKTYACKNTFQRTLNMNLLTPYGILHCIFLFTVTEERMGIFEVERIISFSRNHFRCATCGTKVSNYLRNIYVVTAFVLQKIGFLPFFYTFPLMTKYVLYIYWRFIRLFEFISAVFQQFIGNDNRDSLFSLYVNAYLYF